jgi:hypothetical protein
VVRDAGQGGEVARRSLPEGARRPQVNRSPGLPASLHALARRLAAGREARTSKPGSRGGSERRVSEA